ncbi:hypothetical protein E2C01_013534 [Portunus trituberculatus]|uniref:Uncharacterized protein n=1 Tax=Portunus trituberculatus TaxID=210409 RepID=A0A5B7DGI3_PORTR|nr:hypothetical protein [Portunus trituberculatus]
MVYQLPQSVLLLVKDCPSKCTFHGPPVPSRVPMALFSNTSIHQLDLQQPEQHQDFCLNICSRDTESFTSMLISSSSSSSSSSRGPARKWVGSGSGYSRPRRTDNWPLTPAPAWGRREEHTPKNPASPATAPAQSPTPSVAMAALRTSARAPSTTMRMARNSLMSPSDSASLAGKKCPWGSVVSAVPDTDLRERQVSPPPLTPTPTWLLVPRLLAPRRPPLRPPAVLAPATNVTTWTPFLLPPCVLRFTNTSLGHKCSLAGFIGSNSRQVQASQECYGAARNNLLSDLAVGRLTRSAAVGLRSATRATKPRCRATAVLLRSLVVAVVARRARKVHPSERCVARHPYRSHRGLIRTVPINGYKDTLHNSQFDQ